MHERPYEQRALVLYASSRHVTSSRIGVLSGSRQELAISFSIASLDRLAGARQNSSNAVEDAEVVAKAGG